MSVTKNYIFKGFGRFLMLLLLKGFCSVALHRESKGPKKVFSGGRRQKLSFLSQTFCIRSHLSHHIRIHLNKLQVQFKFKTTFTFSKKYHVFAKFYTRFRH